MSWFGFSSSDIAQACLAIFIFHRNLFAVGESPLYMQMYTPNISHTAGHGRYAM